MQITARNMANRMMCWTSWMGGTYITTNILIYNYSFTVLLDPFIEVRCGAYGANWAKSSYIATDNSVSSHHVMWHFILNTMYWMVFLHWLIHLLNTRYRGISTRLIKIATFKLLHRVHDYTPLNWRHIALCPFINPSFPQVYMIFKNTLWISVFELTTLPVVPDG